MAFKPYSYLKGQPAIMQLPAAAATYTVGQALAFGSGVLTAVTATAGHDTDEGIHYICVEAGVVATAGNKLAVIKADDNIIWETINGADATTLVIGTKYELAVGGLAITDTATKGCFLVIYTEGTDAGMVAKGIFVE